MSAPMPGMRALLRRLAAERGEMTLTAVLVAITIFGTVLGATLTVFTSFASDRADIETRNAAQDAARTAIDRLSRELRNLASPTAEQPEAFDAAGPYDIVFKTVDPNGPNAGLNSPNVKRVRYCLDATTPANARLVFQEQTWTSQAPPPVPATASCPGSGWATTRTLATSITNVQFGMDRPLFAMDSSVLTDINSIRTSLWVDVDSGSGPAETQLTSGIFLRNQNRKPVASFTATPTAQGIMLNGSASFDPEGEPLTYVWYDGATKIGTGITLTYQVPAGTSHSIRLEVYDPAVLHGESDVQVVIA